jgi:hypothetical protein
MNPHLFIVGCGRSGTTLLQRLVDAHRDITIIHETHWIAKWYDRRKGVSPVGLATLKLVSELAEYYRLARWPIEREDLEQLVPTNGSVSYADFVTGFFDLYGERQGKLFAETSTRSRYLSTDHAFTFWIWTCTVKEIRGWTLATS